MGTFATEIMSETIIQIINAVLGIIYVLLEGSASMWLWPLGVIQPVFALIVGWQSQTYSTILVQLYYLIACIIGGVAGGIPLLSAPEGTQTVIRTDSAARPCWMINAFGRSI